MVGTAAEDLGGTPTLKTKLSEYRQWAQEKFGPMTDDFIRLYPASTDEEAGTSKNLALHDQNRISKTTWAEKYSNGLHSALYIYFLESADTGTGEQRRISRLRDTLRDGNLDFDALPQNYHDLRDERDKTAKSIESIRKELPVLYAQTNDHAIRFKNAKLAATKTIELDVSIVALGGEATIAAEETIEHQDSRIKALGAAVDVLVPLAAVFGLNAAFRGVKLEGPD